MTSKWWIDDGDETGAIFIAQGTGDDYRTVAEVINSDADVDVQANASLIAASPEFLEMLSGIATELDLSAETVGGMSTEMCRFFCNSIRAFIAKKLE